MSPSTRACPKCGCLITIGKPTPEKVMCPKCRAILRLKVGAEAAQPAIPLGAGVGPSPAIAGPTVAYATRGAQKTVAGHEIIRELARGGLGVVYLARHPVLGDLRAIKRPQTRDGLERDILLARFRREVQAVGALKHDHIVRALDAGADEDGPYLITEYLDGKPLSRLVSTSRPLLSGVACELIRQAALGLQAAHERGLVHRDVKPSNLMLTRVQSDTARVVVIDWGLVKRAGEGGAAASAANALTRNSGMGTVDFMAPEQIGNASTVDIRADIYSLGATFHFLLTGREPFHGRRETEKLVAHETQPFPPVGRSDVPPQVLAILNRMVEKNPAQRFATPGEVAQALAPYCAPDPRMLLSLLATAIDEPMATETQSPYPTSPGAAPLAQATVLANAPPTWPHASQATAMGVGGGFKKTLLILAGGALLGVLAVVLVLTIGGQNDKDTKTTKSTPSSKPGAERALIDEKFDKGPGLPEGWIGDAFRVVTYNDRHCLEVSSDKGEHLIRLPPVKLTGDFTIEGAYLATGAPWGVQKLTLLLEQSTANAPLPLTITANGDVFFGDDKRNALPSYKLNQPYAFRYSRKGNTLIVLLNEEEVARKDLKTIVPYDKLSVGMPAGSGAIFTRLFNIKVTQP